MLEVKSISKFYGDTMAIENVSFRAEQGQIVGLVGHNGSGKSTTMNIITNCLTPSGGDVLVDGVSVVSDPLSAKRKIGYLPEIPPVYPDMTVNEQLLFACGLRGVTGKAQQQEQIEKACEGLHITGVRKRLIRNLSKGYRQRVGFAQALIGEPPLLVLDEPTVGLDPEQLMELRSFIAGLREKHTVLLSSHILSEIAATCDRVVILSSGHVAADDTIENLSRRASEQEGILLKADGDPEAVIRTVSAVPGVDSVTPEKDGETLKIRAKDGADLHRELFSALASAKMPIKLLSPVNVGLEDIFMQLTHDSRYEDKGEKT